MREWFERHQTPLLALANTRWGRRVLCVQEDVPRDRWVVGLSPHSITWANDSLLEFVQKSRRGEPVSLTTDFRTHAKFEKRLIYGLFPRWKAGWEYVAGIWQRNMQVQPAWASTLTAYPQALSGGTNVTCDAYIYRSISSETLATIRAGAATAVSNSSTAFYVSYLGASATVNQFTLLVRNIATFDTSALGASANISDATLSIKGSSKGNALGSDTTHLVSATPASNNVIVLGDYGQLGTTSFANITYANFSTTAYNDYVSSADLIANISKTGISKFGFRGEWDLNNSFTGVWASGANTQIVGAAADVSGTTSDPKLVVTFTLSAAGLLLHLHNKLGLSGGLL